MLTLSQNKKIIIAAAALILIAGIVLGVVLLSGGNEKKLQKALDLGMQYLNDLDYENAILSFRDAIAIDPMNEEAKNGLITTYRNYGSMCMSDGRYGKAAELYEDLIAYTGKEEDYLLLAQAYAAAGDGENADRILAEMVRLFGKTEDELLDALYIRTVLEKPSCADEGVALLTDRIAGNEREAAIPKSQDHKWGAAFLSKDGGDGKECEITRTCSVCHEMKFETFVGKAISFTDPAFEDAVRRQTGNPEGTLYKELIGDLFVLELNDSGVSSLEDLRYFPNVEILHANNNNISDLSPLSCVPGLKSLWLNNNVGIIDISPIGNLKNLEEFSLTNTEVLDIGAISALHNLQFVQICGNWEHPFDPSPIASLENLTFLNLSCFQAIDFGFLKNNTKLEQLMLQNSQIRNIGFLSELTGLWELDIHGNEVEDISPLRNLTNLETLVINNNNITDISPLSGLTKLKSLSMEANPITDYSPVENIPGLEIRK